MRSYFIDYCKIWIPPTKERWDKAELLEVQNNINLTLFGDDTNLGKCMCFSGMKLHLHGKYFNSFDFCENMQHVFEAVRKVYVLHKKYWNFDEVKPSRLDFACNLPFFLNTHDYSLSSCADENVRKYYYGCESDQNLSGLSVGERGNHSIQLTVYDKRYSPNQDEDKRVKTNNYTRLEYKVGRQILRRRLGIDLLKDMRKYETAFPKDIISSLRKLKDLSFNDEDQFNDRHYTDSDFKNAVGIEVDSPDQEQTIEDIPIADCQ